MKAARHFFRPTPRTSTASLWHILSSKASHRANQESIVVETLRKFTGDQLWKLSWLFTNIEKGSRCVGESQVKYWSFILDIQNTHLLFIDAYLLLKVKCSLQKFLLQHEFLFNLKRILLVFGGARFALFKLLSEGFLFLSKTKYDKMLELFNDAWILRTIKLYLFKKYKETLCLEVSTGQ